MREAEAAQGQAGKVTTYSLPPRAPRPYRNAGPCIPVPLVPNCIHTVVYSTNVLGTANVPDLWNKRKSAGAVLRMHPHLKRVPSQNHRLCVAQLSSSQPFLCLP